MMKMDDDADNDNDDDDDECQINGKSNSLFSFLLSCAITIPTLSFV